MRDIRFRAWQVVTKKIVIPKSLEGTPTGFKYIVTAYPNMTPIECPLMEYTGLKDKSGVDIYERDIVEWFDSDEERRVDQVVWSNGGLVLCNDRYTVGSYKSLNLKVLGNIYEHPHLIPGQEKS